MRDSEKRRESTEIEGVMGVMRMIRFEASRSGSVPEIISEVPGTSAISPSGARRPAISVSREATMPSRIAITAQAANARLTVRNAAIERGRLCPRPLYIDLSLIRNRPNANASDGSFLRFAKRMADAAAFCGSLAAAVLLRLSRSHSMGLKKAEREIS